MIAPFSEDNSICCTISWIFDEMVALIMLVLISFSEWLISITY